jgi:NAD(P) transhydrogenase subunit alpha
MKIAIPKELREDEARVAASPDSVKRMVALGLEVVVESGAGVAAAAPDAAYEKAGAKIAKTAKEALSGADVVLKVRRPMTKAEGTDEFALLPKGAVLISGFDPYRAGEGLEAAAKAGLVTFAMELMPRITRAQSMDILSSQANLAGYKAVLDGTAVFGRAFPMMMTAAGTVPPAKVFVMGAGVAGLQAIATAKRLGAVVSATDVRPAAKEQVQSLGGSFVAVEDEEFKQAETAGGYAKEMSEDYKKKQAALIAETLTKQDMVITTALIPGRPAPKLISEEMVKSMKPGSVIVDIAAENGGNCELTEPGKVVQKHGVTIVGHKNVPGRLPVDASSLFARNLFNFLETLVDKEKKTLAIDWEDDLVKGTLITKDGKVVHQGVIDALGLGKQSAAPADKKAPAKKPAAKKPAAKKAPAKKPAAKKPAASNDKQE